MIREELLEKKDLKYRDFKAKLVPNIEKDKIIGVRSKDLRAIAKKYFQEGSYNDFLKDLPHKYHEEDHVQAFILEFFKDYDLLIEELDRFIPHIDNWAVCDSLNPKIFKKNLDKLYYKIKDYLASNYEYEVRFGIVTAMRYMIAHDRVEEFNEIISKLDFEDYYVNMARAWYFQEALLKEYDKTISYFKEGKLDKFTNNMAIQKIRDSFRVSDDIKDKLVEYRK